MVEVTKEEFDAFVEHHDTVPDGFKANGSYVQTRYLVDGQEVARRSQDSRGTIYEVKEGL